ncbi:Protein of unknown function (DUF2505) [Mycolicibacterium chubuense NBB4]|uniref:Polyketide cyclase / dehydrase and lipid transport n=1 Tax=Mycolicibacterium chubuense (strain NBB4) TaxID=710421 RepID=I4BLU0_MYCCN|nr:DUF2505 domain-containing protein [Mycolicibacterium chubuense]AFM18247.1 Protein of unknown function (DUF2505) [Mycolicibacterium chubuense NBB4]
MSRTVDFAVESTASVEQIHRAFCERDYWLARLKAFGGFGRLDSLEVGADGCATVVVTQDLRHDALPGLVARFFPHEWKVVQNETWGPVEDGRLRGIVSITTYGAPGTGVGKVVMEPVPVGSRLTCAATVEFKVPLVGAMIEAVMGKLLAQQISVIQQFTTKWIAEFAL